MYCLNKNEYVASTLRQMALSTSHFYDFQKETKKRVKLAYEIDHQKRFYKFDINVS